MYTVKELAGTQKPVYRFDGDVERTDAHLVQVIKKLGQAEGSASSALGVVEVPDDVKWTIFNYNERVGIRGAQNVESLSSHVVAQGEAADSVKPALCWVEYKLYNCLFRVHY
jgi:hypothetical protein